MQTPPKKALLAGAFFLAALLFWAAPAQALCPADRIDESARVRHVFDGDTVELDDGRRLRLIGINTPEIGRDGKADEALARTARIFLSERLGESGQQIALRFDRDRKDRYGRLLAHAYLPDGRNLGALLLQQGLGHAITVPPNLWGLECLRQAEAGARSAGLGVWRVERFSGESSRKLSPPSEGFRLVQGRVHRIGESKASIWINLPGNFAVRVARKDLLYFRDLDLHSLQGRTIRVRGWARRDDRETRMQLRHPSMLEILD